MEDRIKQDLKEAMLARNELAVSTLRILISELRNATIAKGNANSTLSESEVISVIQKEIKKRKEGAAGFRQGGREENAQKEESEAYALEKYLPAQLTDEELTKIVEDTINNVGASSVADMGKVIGQVMAKVGQTADGGRVSQIVKENLSK